MRLLTVTITITMVILLVTGCSIQLGSVGKQRPTKDDLIHVQASIDTVRSSVIQFYNEYNNNMRIIDAKIKKYDAIAFPDTTNNKKKGGPAPSGMNPPKM